MSQRVTQRCTIPGMTLGATSFLAPLSYVPGFRHAAALCEDVCLLAMAVGEGGKDLVSRREILEIADIARQENVSVSVHLPCEHNFETKQGARAMVDAVARVLERTAPLAVHTCVLHLEFPSLNDVLLGPSAAHTGLKPEQADWTAAALRDIVSLFDDPRRLAVENLESFPPDFWDIWLDEAPCSRCLDVGHLWKDGWPPEEIMPAWLDRVRIIHLHGLVRRSCTHIPRPVAVRILPDTSLRRQLRGLFGVSPRDHRTLADMPDACVDTVLHLLWRTGWQGVITLELFDTEEFFASHEVIMRSWERYLKNSGGKQHA